MPCEILENLQDRVLRSFYFSKKNTWLVNELGRLFRKTSHDLQLVTRLLLGELNERPKTFHQRVFDVLLQLRRVHFFIGCKGKKNRRNDSEWCSKPFAFIFFEHLGHRGF